MTSHFGHFRVHHDHIKFFGHFGKFRGLGTTHFKPKINQNDQSLKHYQCIQEYGNEFAKSSYEDLLQEILHIKVQWLKWHAKYNTIFALREGLIKKIEKSDGIFHHSWEGGGLRRVIFHHFVFRFFLASKWSETSRNAKKFFSPW